jgi:Bacteriophage head to tail connecting protein
LVLLIVCIVLYFALVEKYKNRDATLDFWYTVVEGVVPEKFMDMPFTRFFILQCPGDHKYDGGLFSPDKVGTKRNKYPGFLRVEGCNEFCYPTYRYDAVGEDEYSVSPGMDAVQTIKRLQEVVKSNTIAYHKSIRPPLNIPIHLKGQVKTYPDAPNYYIDPAQVIKPVYDTRFDHQSAAVMEGQLDKILQEIFYNDVFITASRDPNASPLKATQVNNWNTERFVRIGPILENIFNQGIVPSMIRSFNIMYRAGKLPPLPEEFSKMKPKINLELTSILAQMMKALTAEPVNEFLQMVGAVSQYSPNVLDIPDFDSIVYDYAEIKGVNPKHLNAMKKIAQARQQRAAAQQAEKQRVMAAQEQGMATEADLNRANVAKTMSEAGANFNETMGDQEILL